LSYSCNALVNATALLLYSSVLPDVLSTASADTRCARNK